LLLTGNKRGSVFLQCTEPSLPRYGPQPVVSCARFEREDGGGSLGDAG
jgi:hypothetical protein